MRPGVLALLATSLVVGSTLGSTTEGDPKPDWRNPVRTAEQDLVKNLPGLDAKLADDFRQYSGYLQSYTPGDFSTAMFTHYWFVEAEINPDNAPLLVWLNGGPGTSSLRGLFHENGPFEVAKDGKTLTKRELSWNNLANVLYLESPVPVGFSYSPAREGIYSDRNTMVQVLLGLRSFFQKFPQYASSRLYLAGEGYGAANAFNMAYYQDSFQNLAGLVSASGYLHGRYMDKAGVLAAREHGWVNNATWAQVSDYCCDGEKPTWWGCDMRGKRCSRLTGQIYANIKTEFKLNPFNIHEDCSKSDANCEDSGPVTAYLNQQIVRDALNIPERVGQWQMNRELSDYQADIVSEGDSMLPYVKNSKIPLLVFNGDADIVCSAQASEWFADDLGRRVTVGRLPWKVANKTVGSIKQYNGVTLVTVNNAGHSVAREQPKLAYELVKNFLKGNYAMDASMPLVGQGCGRQGGCGGFGGSGDRRHNNMRGMRVPRN